MVEDIEEVNAYPVYLINDTMDKVINRIGYYELPVDEEPAEDDDGDIDLEQLDEPIIFDYVKTSDYQQILEENIVTTDILKSKNKTKLGFC